MKNMADFFFYSPKSFFSKKNNCAQAGKAPSSALRGPFIGAWAVFALMVGITAGCEPRAELETLKAENERLKLQQDSLVGKLDSVAKLKDSLALLVPKPKVPKATPSDNGESAPRGGGYYTEQEALDYVEDYYDYYRTDYVYRNPRVRRISGNEFNVSLQERMGDVSGEFSWHWEGVVWRLTVKNKSTYLMRILY
jgi:hypothetical protein